MRYTTLGIVFYFLVTYLIILFIKIVGGDILMSYQLDIGFFVIMYLFSLSHLKVVTIDSKFIKIYRPTKFKTEIFSVEDIENLEIRDQPSDGIGPRTLVMNLKKHKGVKGYIKKMFIREKYTIHHSPSVRRLKKIIKEFGGSYKIIDNDEGDNWFKK